CGLARIRCSMSSKQRPQQILPVGTFSAVKSLVGLGGVAVVTCAIHWSSGWVVGRAAHGASCGLVNGSGAVPGDYMEVVVGIQEGFRLSLERLLTAGRAEVVSLTF